MTARRYWVNTVSRDHAQAAVAGGFTQADHGKDTRLKRLNKGDLLVFYSPKTKFRDGEPYQVEMTADFHPWRMKMDFKKGNEIRFVLLLMTSSSSRTKKSGAFRLDAACSR